MFKSCYLFFSKVKTTHKSFPVIELSKHFSSKTEYQIQRYILATIKIHLSTWKAATTLSQGWMALTVTAGHSSCYYVSASLFSAFLLNLTVTVTNTPHRRPQQLQGDNAICCFMRVLNSRESLDNKCSNYKKQFRNPHTEKENRDHSHFNFRQSETVSMNTYHLKGNSKLFHRMTRIHKVSLSQEFTMLSNKAFTQVLRDRVKRKDSLLDPNKVISYL